MPRCGASMSPTRRVRRRVRDSPTKGSQDRRSTPAALATGGSQILYLLDSFTEDTSSRPGAVAPVTNPERLAHYRAMRREVGAEIEVEITAPTTLEFQIAVAPHPRTDVFESLRFVLNGRPIQPLEVSGVHGNRIHKFDAGMGTLKVDYAATIVGQTDPAPVTEYDQSMYLRPSRYAEADTFYGFGATDF